MKRIALYFSLLACVLCATAAPPKKPKLVLAVVIDQFRYDYLLRFRKDYTSGFVRLLERGAVFTDAQYVHFPTVTACGHSTFLTGATPAMSGIVGNEWYDRSSKRVVTSVSDDHVKLLGGPEGRTGSSPHNLLVSSIPDEIKMQGHKSKVIGISIKDRSAILPAGHMADAAYWYDSPSNQWVSSTYYLQELPGWVAEINRLGPAAKYAGAKWFPVDAAPGSAQPFCAMTKSEGGMRPCGPIEATPWGNELIETLAEHAITEEKLGRHDGIDVLAVSFSSNDYVGHAVGPDAPEVRDMSIRTDRLLGKLMSLAEQEAGPGNTLVVLTADHGVAPVPEVNHARKMPGGRVSEPGLMQEMEDALGAKYGSGKWVAANSNGIYLNQELIQSKNLDSAEVERTAAAALESVDHVFRVYTRHQLLTGQVLQDPVTAAIERGFFARRGADVIPLLDPYYLTGSSGTTHGTPFDYDTHVPIIFMGPGIKAGRFNQTVKVNDIAPTLATILGVEIPSGSIGRVLGEILE
jgi:predicted AlkP superfamily pyrophosphatase or phosphodiesterase